MKEYPTFETKRLFLRPFFIHDARDVRRLAGDPDVVVMLFTFDPRTQGVAEQWIVDQHEHFEKGDWVNLAITERSRGLVIGSIGLDINLLTNKAEIMYWLGKEYWGRGYATEAAHVVMNYGFDTLALNCIYARYLTGNHRSARVLEKVGMVYQEMTTPHCIHKGSMCHPVELVAIDRDRYNTLHC